MTEPNSFTTEPWHILGAGSIGLLVASYLHSNAVDVRVLNRHKITGSHNVTVVSDEQKGSLHIPFEPLEIDEPIKGLIVCTKNIQIQHIIAKIEHRLNAESSVIFLQNGMGHFELIRSRYPFLKKMYLGSVTHGAFRTETFSVNHAGKGHIFIGSPDLSVKRAPEELQSLLRAHNLSWQWDPDIEQRLWKKLVINACINPLTALLKCSNGELKDLKSAQIIMDNLCRESEQILSSIGFNLKASEILEMTLNIAAQTSSNRSSMLQDLLASKPTEIDAITGFLIKKASEHRISVPTHETLYNLVKARESLAIRV